MSSSKSEQDNSDSEEKASSGKWYLTFADNENAADAKAVDYDSDIYGAHDLICRFCHKLVVDAVTTYCCDTLYCRSCILPLLEEVTKCPTCSKILDFGGLHPNIRAELRSRAWVRGCSHRIEGCSFRGNRSELDDHLHFECNYSQMKINHDRKMLLIDESKHAWETSNPHLHAFRDIHFNRALDKSESSTSTGASLIPGTVKFFSYSNNPSPTSISMARSQSLLYSFGISSRTLEPDHIPDTAGRTGGAHNVGPWKLTWLVEYRWKVHACIHIEHESIVKLFFYKDIDVPSSVVASVQLLSPFGPHKNQLFSTGGSDKCKWKARHLSEEDSVIVNVWDFGEIMKTHQFAEFCYDGKFALAAMLEH